MLWLWIALAVVGAWFLVAGVLALVIGRAAHMGETKYQDEMFLRKAAQESRAKASVPYVA